MNKSNEPLIKSNISSEKAEKSFENYEDSSEDKKTENLQHEKQESFQNSQHDVLDVNSQEVNASNNNTLGESNEDSLESSQKDKSKSLLRNVLDYVVIVLCALTLSYLLNHYVIANAVIPSGSMENTVMTGDRIIGFRLSYLFSDPQRGDIVIFRFPDDESQDYLKRIIGLPGDVIDIVDGKVYINESDTPLEEDYLKETPSGDFGPYKVPEDSYFLMGDNREDSFDSRYWENTFVKKDAIIAKAIFRYYPNIKVLD